MSFKEFWPFYVDQHKNPMNRLLHVVGTLLGVGLLVFSLGTEMYWLLALVPVVSYAFAWVGHLYFEKNKPATWQAPLYSLLGDFKMLFLILTGRYPDKN